MNPEAMTPSMSLMHASLLGNNPKVVLSSEARAALNSSPWASVPTAVSGSGAKTQQIPQAFVPGFPLAPAALNPIAVNGSNPAVAAAAVAVSNMFPAAAAYMMPFMAMAAAAAAAANTSNQTGAPAAATTSVPNGNTSTSNFPGSVSKTFNNFHQQQPPFVNLTNKQQPPMLQMSTTAGFNPHLFHQLSNPAQFFQQQQQQQLQQQQQQQSNNQNNTNADHMQQMALLQHYQNTNNQNPTSSSKLF